MTNHDLKRYYDIYQKALRDAYSDRTLSEVSVIKRGLQAVAHTVIEAYILESLTKHIRSRYNEASHE